MDNRFTSTLAGLIQAAVNECIEYGQGSSRVAEDDINPDFSVSASWCGDEDDIEIALMQDGVVLCVFIEKDVAGKVYGS